MLHDDGSRSHLVAVAHITDPECHQVATTQLAADTEVEECQLSNPALQLKTHTQRPDIFEFEGRFLTNDFSLVPRRAVNSRT